MKGFIRARRACGRAGLLCRVERTGPNERPAGEVLDKDSLGDVDYAKQVGQGVNF